MLKEKIRRAALCRRDPRGCVSSSVCSVIFFFFSEEKEKKIPLMIFLGANIFFLLFGFPRVLARTGRTNNSLCLKRMPLKNI